MCVRVFGGPFINNVKDLMEPPANAIGTFQLTFTLFNWVGLSLIHEGKIRFNNE